MVLMMKHEQKCRITSGRHVLLSASSPLKCGSVCQGGSHPRPLWQGRGPAAGCMGQKVSPLSHETGDSLLHGTVQSLWLTQAKKTGKVYVGLEFKKGN